MSYCATCDAAFFRGKPVAVIGNDDHAAEEALFVTRFSSAVHFVMPTDKTKISPERWQEVSTHERVRTHLGWHPTEFVGGPSLTEIRFETSEGPRSLAVPGAFLLLHGAAPTTSFLLGSLETRESGCLVKSSLRRHQPCAASAFPAPRTIVKTIPLSA